MRLARTPFESHTWTLSGSTIALELLSRHDKSWLFCLNIFVKTCTYRFKACVGLVQGLCTLSARLVGNALLLVCLNPEIIQWNMLLWLLDAHNMYWMHIVFIHSAQNTYVISTLSFVHRESFYFQLLQLLQEEQPSVPAVQSTVEKMILKNLGLLLLLLLERNQSLTSELGLTLVWLFIISTLGIPRVLLLMDNSRQRSNIGQPIRSQYVLLWIQWGRPNRALLLVLERQSWLIYMH